MSCAERRVPWAVALGSALVMAVVGVVAVAAQATPRSEPTPAAERVVSSARHRFTEVTELRAASDLVVVGRVVADEAGRLFGTPGSASAVWSHVLTVEVEEVLAGPPPSAGALVLVEEEHTLADGTPVVVDGMRAGRVGDRGVWFLAAGADPEVPAFAVVNAQGRYLYAGRDGLVGGDRRDGLVRRVEATGAARLREQVAGP